MGLKRRPRLSLEDRKYITWWPDDDAIDPEHSDLIRYCRGLGDTGALKARQGQRPAEIVFRPLSEMEINAVAGVGPTMSPFEAFRYGIESIEEIDLRKISLSNGLVGLSRDCLRELADDFRMKLPAGYAIDLRDQAMDSSIQPREEVPWALISLPALIGVIIQVHSFRERGGF